MAEPHVRGETPLRSGRISPLLSFRFLRLHVPALFVESNWRGVFRHLPFIPSLVFGRLFFPFLLLLWNDTFPQLRCALTHLSKRDAPCWIFFSDPLSIGILEE